MLFCRTSFACAAQIAFERRLDSDGQNMSSGITSSRELRGLLQDIAAKYGALSEEDGVAFRATYIINPEGILEHISINNMGIGRNIDETKRVLQAVQFVAEHGEVRPESSHARPHADGASPADVEGARSAYRSPHTCIAKLKCLVQHDTLLSNAASLQK